MRLSDCIIVGLWQGTIYFATQIVNFWMDYRKD